MATILRIGTDSAHHYLEGASCALGVFDGVHLGHQYLIKKAMETSAANQGKSVALTFDIDPDEIFHPGRLQKLMSNEDRIMALEQSGVDEVCILPFSREFASLSPADFLDRTFNGYPPSCVHIGIDFRFGAKAAGSVEDLLSWGRVHGMQTCPHDLKSADDLPITSTRIRLLLAETQIEKANELLGRPYFVRAIVQKGRGEGGDMGFRTANLKLDQQLQTLGDGVYAGYASVDEVRYKAAISVGVSPTFKEEATATCEAHILDFDGVLYQKPLKVEFVSYLRPMIRFETKDELMETVLGNIAWVREHL